MDRNQPTPRQIDALAKQERLYAAQRALESIAYSEGVFSARYSRVANGIGAY